MTPGIKHCVSEFQKEHASNTDGRFFVVPHDNYDDLSCSGKQFAGNP